MAQQARLAVRRAGAYVSTRSSKSTDCSKFKYSHQGAKKNGFAAKLPQLIDLLGVVNGDRACDPSVTGLGRNRKVRPLQASAARRYMRPTRALYRTRYDAFSRVFLSPPGTHPSAFSTRNRRALPPATAQAKHRHGLACLLPPARSDAHYCTQPLDGLPAHRRRTLSCAGQFGRPGLRMAQRRSSSMDRRPRRLPGTCAATLNRWSLQTQRR